MKATNKKGQIFDSAYDLSKVIGVSKSGRKWYGPKKDKGLELLKKALKPR